MQVVLVRPWTDAHGGTGCCGGDVRDGICLEERVGGPRTLDTETGLVAEAYLHLSRALPEVDVQIVGVGNTAYLLPSVFRAIRARHGTLAALRGLNRATTAGSVLVDGECVGRISEIGVEGALREVRLRSPGRPARPPGRPRPRSM